MLPQPKNAVTSTITSKSLIPHVLTQKPKNSTVKKKTPLPTPAKPAQAKTLGIAYSDESDNDEDGEQNDFFSINKPVELPVADLPLDIDGNPGKSIDKVLNNPPPVQREVRNVESYFKQDEVENHVELQPDESSYYDEPASSYSAGNVNGESSSNELALDEEAVSIKF